MGLQLVDGETKHPMGLLKNILVSTCGIKFKYTFAVVDIEHDPNYELIVRWSFIRQMLVVQDWGYNNLYLCHSKSIIRVELHNHTYRDITKTPIKEFELASFDFTK